MNEKPEKVDEAKEDRGCQEKLVRGFRGGHDGNKGTKYPHQAMDMCFLVPTLKNEDSF